MAEPKKKEILLESGTNELEVLEFTISDQHFGINVSKVVELMPYERVTPMPNSNPYVEGVFKPRDKIMTLINLAAYMGLSEQGTERDIYIITNFNKNHSAFHVHTVEDIHRISWDKIEKPDRAIYGGGEGLATGITRIDDRLITIVDFEKILADINPASAIQVSDVEKMGERARSTKPIMLAEDSALLEKMIMEALDKAGYSNILMCTNGKEAWDAIQAFRNSGKPLADCVTCLITDIEMPQMDGHRLCKLVREDEYSKELPVIIFSSLINPEMRLKGQSVGATAQITKPEIALLVNLIDKHAL